MPSDPEPDPEPYPDSDDDDLAAPVREFRDRVAPRINDLRAAGLEIDEFLADCDRFLAWLEGGAWFDSGMMMARLASFSEEVEAYNELQREASRISAEAALPGMLDYTARLAAAVRDRSEATNRRTATDLERSVAEARARVARGESAIEQLEDISLTLSAHIAELARRDRFRSAATALYWESRPPEWWTQRTPEERAKIEPLLAQWRKERGLLLSELPLEDRRRLEALRPGDFDNPEAITP